MKIDITNNIKYDSFEDLGISVLKKKGTKIYLINEFEYDGYNLMNVLVEWTDILSGKIVPTWVVWESNVLINKVFV